MTTDKLILKPETALEKAVAKWVKAQAADYENDVRGPLKDLFYGGCSSGMVSDLIYYYDTLKFYKRHKADIHALLKNAMDDQGVKYPGELFAGPNGSNRWDDDDPFAEESTNQNLLAWFGFEEAARNLANRAGYDG